MVVRHGEDGVHIAVSRVSFDGQVWPGRRDNCRAQAVCTWLEQKYGLIIAPRRGARPWRRSGWPIAS